MRMDENFIGHSVKGRISCEWRYSEEETLDEELDKRMKEGFSPLASWGNMERRKDSLTGKEYWGDICQQFQI